MSLLMPESLELQVLTALEELLKDRPPSAHPVDTNIVLAWMRQEAEHFDELAQCMSDLWEKGDILIRGAKPLTGGDGKVLDVTVKAITEQGLRRLHG